ncbi:MAG: type III-B CRISPR module RAMP protein Cmr4 [Polyangiaceae bacterium]|nr:type III-B CRISPR module RAMP protein Cmr4 [Polyangiaceae bacterium]
MTQACETGIFTLTPLHCGTGQAFGAVDLPIARERHTRFPIIPSSSLKGVLRDAATRAKDGSVVNDDTIKRAFGPRPPRPGEPEPLTPGALIFTDAQLLLFPVRSLSRPFYWVTCPLAISRWRRTRHSLGLSVMDMRVPESDDDGVYTSFPLKGGPLVLEDAVVQTTGLKPETDWLGDLLKQWCRLLPGSAEEAAGIPKATVCIPDSLFTDLVVRTTPVNARIQLTDGKTTDRWQAENREEQKGNLWYEETLPSECLLSAFVAQREGKENMLQVAKAALTSSTANGCHQIGGNASVGQGLCWWNLEQAQTTETNRS